MDWAVLAAYLLLSLGLGLRLLKRQTGADEYFLASRSMSWWALGLSVMVTAFSAINYTAFAGEVYKQGLYVFLSVPVFLLIGWPVSRWVLPFWSALRVTSAYEVLEGCGGPRLRKLGALTFLIWHLFWVATLLYVPAKVLALITGWPLWQLVLLIGVVAVVYTSLGGMRAVVYTDVMQFVVLAGGLLFAVVIAAKGVGGFGQLLRDTAAHNGLRPFYPWDPQVLSLNPQIRITLPSALIGTFVAFLSRYGVDQVVVQRWFAARDLRQARRAFWLNAFAAVFALSLLALFGFAIAAHSRITGLAAPAPMAHFAALVRDLPAGITGLLTAGLLAAAMSSLDSGINSLCAVTVRDLLPLRREPSMFQLRLLTLSFGLLATLGALYVGRLGSLFVIANRVLNGLGAPLLALFLVALFMPRISSRALFWGGLSGVAMSILISFRVQHLALHYYAVVNLLVSLAALFACGLPDLLKKRSLPPSRLAWTWKGVIQAHSRNPLA